MSQSIQSEHLTTASIPLKEEIWRPQFVLSAFTQKKKKTPRTGRDRVIQTMT